MVSTTKDTAEPIKQKNEMTFLVPTFLCYKKSIVVNVKWWCDIVYKKWSPGIVKFYICQIIKL